MCVPSFNYKQAKATTSQPMATVFDVVTAVSTAAAAIFAAVSAWASARSASATKDSVREAREARKAELAPQMVMERRFLDLQFIWPHSDGLNGGPLFVARKHSQDRNPSAPLFSLQNFGQSPAVDVTACFELDDNNDDLSVPPEWQAGA